MSILPAYILSKKQKSIDICFDLLKLYSHKNKSIEQILNYFDKSNHFESITTLRKYFSILINQLDEILKSLTTKIFQLKSSNKYPDILPDNKTTNAKLIRMFDLINQLIKLLHELDIQIILESEIPFFLNYFLFTESNILLLADP